MRKSALVIGVVFVLGFSVLSPLVTPFSGQGISSMQMGQGKIEGSSNLLVKVTTPAMLDRGAEIFFTLTAKRGDTNELVQIDNADIRLETQKGLLLDVKHLDGLSTVLKRYYGTFPPIGADGLYNLSAKVTWQAPWGEQVTGADFSTFELNRFYNITGKMQRWKDELYTRLSSSIHVFNNTTAITNQISEIDSSIARMSDILESLWSTGRRTVPSTWNITVLNISSCPSSTTYDPTDSQVSDAITMLNNMGISTVRTDITTISGFKELVEAGEGEEYEDDLFVINCHGKNLPTPSTRDSEAEVESWFENVSASAGRKDWRWLSFDDPFKAAGFDNGTTFTLGMEGWDKYLRYGGVRYDAEAYNYTVETSVSSVEGDIVSWIENNGGVSLPGEITADLFSVPDDLVSSSCYSNLQLPLIEGSSATATVLGTDGAIDTSLKAGLGILAWRWKDIGETLSTKIGQVLSREIDNATIRGWFKDLQANISQATVNFDLSKIKESISGILNRTNQAKRDLNNNTIKDGGLSIPSIGTFGPFGNKMGLASRMFGGRLADIKPGDLIQSGVSAGVRMTKQKISQEVSGGMMKAYHKASETNKEVENGNEEQAETTAKDLNDTANRIEYFANPSGSFLGDIVEGAKKVANKVKQGGKKIYDKFKQGMEEAGDFARDVAKTIKQSLKDWEKNITDVLSEYNISKDDFMYPVLTKVGDLAQKGADKIDNLLEKKSGALPTGLLQMTVFSTFEFAYRMVIQLGVKIQEFINKVKGWLNDLWEKAKDWINKVRDMAKELYNKIKNRVADLAKKVERYVKNILGNVTHAFNKALNWMKNKTQEVWQKTKALFTKTHKVMQKAFNYMQQGFTSAVQTSSEMIMSSMTTLMNKRFMRVNKRVSNLYDVVGDIIETLDSITGVLDKLVNYVQTVSQSVETAIVQAINITIDFITKKLSKVLDSTANVKDKLGNATDTMGKISGFLPDFMQKMKTDLEGITRRAKQVFYAIEQRGLTKDLFFALGRVTASASSLRGTTKGKHIVPLGFSKKKMLLSVRGRYGLKTGETLPVSVKTAKNELLTKTAERVKDGIYAVGISDLKTGKYLATAEARGSPTTYMSTSFVLPELEVGKDLAGFLSLRHQASVPTGGSITYTASIENEKHSRATVKVRTKLVREGKVFARRVDQKTVGINEKRVLPQRIHIPYFTDPGVYRLVVEVVEPNGQVSTVRSTVTVYRSVAEYLLWTLIIAAPASVLGGFVMLWRRVARLEKRT